jgi:carbon monoxide dehydrogenase subunit G
MLLEGKFTIRAPIEKIWDLLLKPEVLASCIPGCQKMEIIDDKTYFSIVKQKVGPISITFEFTTNLTELNPPVHLKTIGKGSAMSHLGNFSQQTEIDLKESMEGQVELSYKSSISVVGKLATFGERIMRAKAKEVGDEFTRALQEKLVSIH